MIANRLCIIMKIKLLDMYIFFMTSNANLTKFIVQSFIIKSRQGHSKAGQVIVNPEHYVIKCMGGT